jgi:hypothetical protein
MLVRNLPTISPDFELYHVQYLVRKLYEVKPRLAVAGESSLSLSGVNLLVRI